MCTPKYWIVSLNTHFVQKKYLYLSLSIEKKKKKINDDNV